MRNDGFIDCTCTHAIQRCATIPIVDFLKFNCTYVTRSEIIRVHEENWSEFLNLNDDDDVW